MVQPLECSFSPVTHMNTRLHSSVKVNTGCLIERNNNCNWVWCKPLILFFNAPACFSQIRCPALQPVLQDEIRGGCTELTWINTATIALLFSSPHSLSLPTCSAPHSGYQAPSWGESREVPDLSLSRSVPVGFPPSTRLFFLDTLNRPVDLNRRLSSCLQVGGGLSLQSWIGQAWVISSPPLFWSSGVISSALKPVLMFSSYRRVSWVSSSVQVKRL